MKKKITLFILCISLPAFLLAQGCLPSGIIFHNQASIDNFQTNHPGCTIIEGDVNIGNGYSNDISNLNGLSVLTVIEGNLTIDEPPNLNSLSGLSSLTRIEGDFTIETCPLLTDFTGMTNLNIIYGDFVVGYNNGITSFSGLSSLTRIGGEFNFHNDTSFISFNGLNNLTYCGGIYLQNLTNLIDFTGLSSLDTIDGTFNTYSCNNATSYNGLQSLTYIDGNFTSNDNRSMTSVDGLNNLTAIGGLLAISQMNGYGNMGSLSAFSNLTSIGGSLKLSGLDSLTTLSPLSNLTSIGGEIEIGNNDKITSLIGLENIAYQSITNLKITYNAMLSQCEIASVCNYLADPQGTIWLHNNASGCDSEAAVIAACNSGIDESVNISFSIFPNPANDYLHLDIPANLEIISIEIFNIAGKKMFSGEYQNPINIKEFPAGQYYIKAITNKGAAKKLFIKN